MLRRGFRANGTRTKVPSLVTVRSAQLTSRRLFANQGFPPPSSSNGGGGGKVFGLLVGAAAVASAWTGYRYATEPPFRARINDLWASLSSSVPSLSSDPRPPVASSSPTPTSEALPLEQGEADTATGAFGETSFAPLEIAPEAEAANKGEEESVELPEVASSLADDELVSSPPIDESEAVKGQEVHEQQEPEMWERTQESDGGEQLGLPASTVPAAVLIPVLTTEVSAEAAGTAPVPPAVVALLTESLAASDELHETPAAAAQSADADVKGEEAKEKKEEEEQHQMRAEEHIVTDQATRLQELQAIKEIIAVQAESCDRQVKKKVERLHQKYEQKMAALRQHMEELVAEHVDVERHKLAEEFQNRYHQELESLQQQFLDERQRLYEEVEDLVAGLNARFVELLREEKRLLQTQLDDTAQLHAQTFAYLQALVEDAEYRSRHLGEEREWWSWMEKLAGAVRALESAALCAECHLHPFQAELDLVRSLAATRPVYKAVAPHIEAHAPRGVYSVGRLRERFDQVEKHVRVAAMVPEGGGLLSHAVAPLLAATAALNPYHQPTSQELLLDSARRHLQEDDPSAALRDMEQLTGLARELANDWIEEARKRLVVEQAISVISADLATHKPLTGGL